MEHEQQAKAQRVTQAIGNIMEKLILPLVPDFKLTLIARIPGKPEAEMVISDDPDYDGLKETLERTKTRTNLSK